MKNLNSPYASQNGFSLVELMIAIFIGLILVTGLISIFDTSSRLNRTQNGLARIQENGRYALSIMKQEIEQAGYHYCIAESNQPIPVNTSQTPKLAWEINASSFPGFQDSVTTDFFFDPAHLLHGHDCVDGTCSPSLTSTGSDTLALIPTVGTTDGSRIKGTDILTLRYIQGPGREIETIEDMVINFSTWSTSNPPASPVAAYEQALIVDCSDNPPFLVDVSSVSSSSMTVVSAPPQNSNSKSLGKVFDFNNDFVTKTYYVANKIVDGRSIPSLYRVDNGQANEIIQGVDAFDVMYGVKDFAGGLKFLTASQVSSFTTADCSPAPQVLNSSATIVNTAGCGWRSVVSVEIHLLLNTVYNSSSQTDEPFKYSQYGITDVYYGKSSIPSDIPHYSMHRREFFTTIALKNIMH